MSESVDAILEELRDAGFIPIGILSYSTKDDQLKISIVRGVDPQEANAILQKFGLKGDFK